ncbi:MAG: lactate utilization protein [Betaproteobacteria bacterium]|nr:lactate utilization protein [Betaproteobacteria bacterium]
MQLILECGGDFAALRERGRQIREESVARMPELLREFEKNAAAAGTKVLWAKDAAAAQKLFVQIARRHGVKTAIKSKSMAGEEIALNGALEAAGVETTETDLGEFIARQKGDAPSHIIAPVMHLRRAEAAAALRLAAPCPDDSAESIARAARAHLRKKFLSADMGISGANFLVADSGAAVVVTNEGNGRMTAALPRIHAVLAGIDKIIPRWSELPDLLTLLARSATGQRLGNYASISAGPGKDGEGPEHAYVVLLDNGRSRLRASDCRDMLRCIRCGACMNHCPVYHAIGGHAYGAVYMGPMGQVLTPALRGLEAAPDLPYAATMCGACAVVCPVKIPLPDLMRRLRRRAVARKIRPLRARLLMQLWLFAARRPAAYAFCAAALCRVLAFFGGKRRRIKSLPFVARGWFRFRDLAAPCGLTFRAARRRKNK